MNPIQRTVSQMTMEDVETFLMEVNDHRARAFENNRMAIEDDLSYTMTTNQTKTMMKRWLVPVQLHL